ncbi:hypothetical protein PR048_031911 [Dryococelus australis]|uniref:Integrase zinc-binding domain-containing protein n=1 Tax=Dryococelus australis TaxID=614101 RepID=A0ABQ9G6M4_9NEOP|nr:hypothetical protein PR048_031911 [Dryococelus australis]
MLGAIDDGDATYSQYTGESTPPVTNRTIRHDTKIDSLLTKVIRYFLYSWPKEVPDNIKTVLEASGPVNVGGRIAAKIARQSLARAYFRWPYMDKKIEELGNACTACQTARPNPATIKPQPREFATSPWQRVHVDFLGPCNGKLYHVVVDPYTKWLEVAEVLSTAAIRTISWLGLAHALNPSWNLRIEYDLLRSTGGEPREQHSHTTLVGAVKREFQVGNAVRVRMYNGKCKWMNGTVVANKEIEECGLQGIAEVDRCQEKGSSKASELVVQDEGGVEKSLEVTGKTGKEGQEVAQDTETEVRGMDVEIQAPGVTWTVEGGTRRYPTRVRKKVVRMDIYYNL